MIFTPNVCFKKVSMPLFITIIPKQPRVVDIKDFRPINLVGAVYKIVAKVLASGLQMVVEKIISEPQCFHQG